MPKTMNCRDVGLRIQSYLDGELDQARLDGIRAHLEDCVDCGLDADVFRAIKTQLAGIAPHGDRGALDRLRDFSETIAGRAAVN